MSLIESSKLRELQNYYKNTGLVLVGLNDSQGVNTTTLFRKGLLEYLSGLLSTEQTDATIINSFSLMFNKTEHIDYFLKSNLSMADIKDLQVLGMVSALEKAMKDFGLPKIFGKIGYVSKALYKKSYDDSSIFFTDSIRNASEPIIIYSSGANDLMREGWNNPFKISKDYHNRNKNDNYKYTLTKFQNPETVKSVLGRVERNFNNILSLNEHSDIYALGIYVPKSMQAEGMDIFNEAIAQYNLGLIDLCKQYNMQFIDTEANSNKYNKSKTNFHVTTHGHNALATSILEYIYIRKFMKEACSANFTIQSDLEISNSGLQSILVDLKHDLCKLQKNSIGHTRREAEVDIKKIEEIQRQAEVVEKVLSKKCKIY